jgi:amidophosphoribosyltransferase
MESCAFPNLGYEVERELGPGEIALIRADGVQVMKPAGKKMRICAFLWIYYGFPASSYEGINVEDSRYRCGAAMARRDTAKVDVVAGIPDSGVAHALGYALESRVPYKRPFVKYTPTWARSFMPQNQATRDQVARMKLIPIKALVEGKRLLFCDDSVVRGTQLQGTFKRIYGYGAAEIHLRPACPPLLFGCKYLNFSRSRSEMDLAARRAIVELEGSVPADLSRYCDHETPEYAAMVAAIEAKMGVTSLRFQVLEDMIEAIGMDQEKICTYCWNGRE